LHEKNRKELKVRKKNKEALSMRFRKFKYKHWCPERQCTQFCSSNDSPTQKKTIQKLQQSVEGMDIGQKVAMFLMK
jgi:hypothetical protein